MSLSRHQGVMVDLTPDQWKIDSEILAHVAKISLKIQLSGIQICLMVQFFRLWYFILESIRASTTKLPCIVYNFTYHNWGENKD